MNDLRTLKEGLNLDANGKSSILNDQALPKDQFQTARRFPHLTLRSDRKVSPRTGSEHEVFVIDAVDWVNVVAVTADNHLVMVEQYRHGTNTVGLEIPGGMVDREDASPVAAGVRELREETGYEGQTPRILGKILPNPAIQSNTCHTVLVENCRLKHA